MSEATPEDVEEQRSGPSGDAPVHPPPDVPLEADSADAYEQALVVELDEDDRR